MKLYLLELPKGAIGSEIFSLGTLQCPLIAYGPHASVSFFVDWLVATFWHFPWFCLPRFYLSTFFSNYFECKGKIQWFKWRKLVKILSWLWPINKNNKAIGAVKSYIISLQQVCFLRLKLSKANVQFFPNQIIVNKTFEY